MLGGVAVEKKINPRETAQICVGLRIGQLVFLSERSDTSHHILYSIKYFLLIHYSILYR